MKFGVLKDIKNGEYRVVATPAEVSILTEDGHDVYVARKAGYAAGFDDEEYEQAGATMTASNEEIWQNCDFVAKVKEIEDSEYDLMREGQIIYCCIHPAAHKAEVDALLEKKSDCNHRGRFPIGMVRLIVRQPARLEPLWACGL